MIYGNLIVANQPPQTKQKKQKHTCSSVNKEKLVTKTEICPVKYRKEPKTNM